MGDTSLHSLEQVVARSIIGAVERLLESHLVCGSVALENQATQAQQCRAVVTAVIHTALERSQHRVGNQGCQLGQRVARKLFLQEPDDHAGQTFAGLQRDVADKSVANDDVDRALEDVVAFDVAVEVEVAQLAGRTQQLAGFLDDFTALDGFFADIEQAHAGVVVVIQNRCQRRAHHRELKQVLCRAIHVGTQVEHGGGTALGVGHAGGDGRALDAVEGLEQITGDRHQRTGVSGGNGDLRRAVLHLADGHAHGRIFFSTQGNFNRIVHSHHFGGGNDGGARMRKTRQLVGLTDQQQPHIGMVRQELLAGSQGDTRTVVTPHAINGQRDHERRPLSPRLRKTGAAQQDMKETAIKDEGPGYEKSSAGLGGRGDQASDLFFRTWRPR